MSVTLLGSLGLALHGCVEVDPFEADDAATSADTETPTPAGLGNSCEAPVEIPGLPYSFFGDLGDFSDTFHAASGQCADVVDPALGGGQGTPDVVFLLQPETTGSHEVSVEAPWDNIVYVIAGACAPEPASCVGGDGGADGSLEVWLTAGAAYHVVVDGASAGAPGQFTVHVSAPR